ncbi:MAG: BMC domain-containing protein [Elusimicrobiota bacterium]|nr:BMC domain-containing protein [Elusimicrobiota bacterium]
MKSNTEDCALAFVETEGRAGIIAALDIMPKISAVSFVRRVRLGRGINAVIFKGDVGAAGLARQYGENSIAKLSKLIASNVIPRPDKRIYELIMQKTAQDIPVVSKVTPLAAGSVEAMGFTGMIAAADAGIKESDVEISGWLTAGGGQTSVFFRGEVGAVRAAVDAGKAAAEKISEVVGTLVLPNPHHGTEFVVPLGKSNAAKFSPEVAGETALAIIETRGFTGLFDAMDAGQKAAEIKIQGWSKIGKGLMSTIFRGEVANVQAALDAGRAAAEKSGGFIAGNLIPRPHEAVEKGR